MAMKAYLLIARGDHETWDAFTDEENEQLEQRFGAWISSMQENWIEGHGVSAHRAELSKGANDSVDVSRDESESTAVTGFFLFRAQNMEQAIEIAKGCPALQHDSLELHELEAED